MRTRSSVLSLVSVFSLLSLGCKEGGCGGSKPESRPAVTASAAVSAPPAPRARTPFVRASGATGALFRAANAVGLDATQSATVAQIATDLRNAEKAAREAGDGGARAELREAQDDLALAVKAGKVDLAKLEPRLDALEKAAGARQEREAEALNRLHAALTPTQRTAAVTVARSVEEKRRARIKAAEIADGGSFGRMRHAQLLRGVDLDAAQAKKVEAIGIKEVSDAGVRDEEKKQFDAILAGFEGTDFDAKKLGAASAKHARQQIEHQAKYLAQLAPILTPEQRERVARNVTRPVDGAGMVGRPHGGLGARDRGDDRDDDDER